MKKLLALLSLLVLCGLSTPVFAQLGSPVEPGLSPYVRKNYGVFTGPVQAANYASGSEPTSPAPRTGDFIYDTTNSALSFWNGSAWTGVGGSAASFDAITSGTNTTAAMVVGTGGSLTVAGSGTINATTLLAATWAAPNAIGSVTPAAIAGTTIDGPLGSVTPAAIAGTTLDTSGVASILADAVTNGNGLLVSADGISGGNGILFSSSSTAGTASSSSILHQIARTGNNANNSHLAYGLYVSVANTGTTNTNVAGYFGASGASTSNVGIHVGAGVAQFDGGINLVNGDLDLADGTVIDFDAGDVTVTHSTGKLALSGSLTVSEVAAASGTPNIMTLTGASHTGLTATTEVIGVYYDLSATKTWATGAIALQREVYIQAPTYSAVGATTITTASTISISGPPIAGANATITSPWALTVEDGDLNIAAIDGSLHIGAADGAQGAPSIYMSGQKFISNGYGFATNDYDRVAIGNQNIGHNALGGVGSGCVSIGAQAGFDSQSVFIGFQATPYSNKASKSVVVGYQAADNAALDTDQSVYIGHSSGNSATNGDYCTHVGANSGNTAGTHGTVSVGNAAGVTGNYGIALGYAAVAGASQFVVGSTNAPITTAYIGEGVTSASPGALLLSATGGTTGAASINASTLTIQGGLPSGAGTGGSVIIATTDGVDPGGFGAQVPTTVVTFDGSATAASTFAGGISSPGSGSSSEKFGAGAIAGGNSNTVVGAGATSVDIGAHNNTLVGAATVNFNNNSNANNTMIGFNQTNASGNASQTSVGYQTVNASSTGIIVGASSTIGASSGSTILIGFSSDIAASSAESILIGRDGLIAHTESILIAGRSGTTTANNQFVVGSASSPITTAYIGEGVTSATPGSLLLSTTGASGSDIAAGTFTIAGGTSTGSGSGGDLVFQVHDGADAAAATPNVLTTVMTMVAGVVRYPKIETQIAFAEVTEPADVGSYGQLYTTTSNDLRFKGGDGVDNQVTLHDGAKYYFAAVIAALDLTEANIDHGIDAATTEHMDGTWTFKAGTNGATGGFTITDVANDGAGDIRCTTSAAHGITAPSVVVITNTSDAVDLPNGSYYVAVVSDTTHFDLLGATYTSTTATADYIEPSQLTAGASDAGQYDIEWDLNQEASGAGSTYITKSWKCTSAGVCAAYASGTRERTTTTTTIGHYYGKSIESAVASGDKYFLTVQAGATNVDPTNKYGSLSTRRH